MTTTVLKTFNSVAIQWTNGRTDVRTDGRTSTWSIAFNINPYNQDFGMACLLTACTYSFTHLFAHSMVQCSAVQCSAMQCNVYILWC